MNKTPSRILCAAIVIIAPARAFGTYQVSCDGSPFSVAAGDLTSVFGEVRTSTSAPTVPLRLHLGADVTNTCTGSNTVQAVVSGTIEQCWSSSSGNDKYTKIRDDANQNHEFVYEHVTPSICSGHVDAGITTIGNIMPAWNHLHVQEQICDSVIPCPTSSTGLVGPIVRINPLLSGRLDYSDSVAPSFINTTIGSFSGQAMFFIPDYTGGLDAVQPTPIPFQPTANGIYYLKGKIDILLNVTGAAPGHRKGVYSVGYSVSQQGITTSILGTYGNQIPSTAGKRPDAQTIFMNESSNSMMYIATNRTISGSCAVHFNLGHGKPLIC